MNLLMPIGQFGTRIDGGKDSTSTQHFFKASLAVDGKISSFSLYYFPIKSHGKMWGKNCQTELEDICILKDKDITDAL